MMLSPYELVNALTPDEFIALCSQIDGKFVVEVIERDENLDPIAFIRLPDNELKAIKVTH
jgi:hypothetical protein